MDELLELSERPTATELYMIAGWRQWADAGAASSALPQYLVDQIKARPIGRIKSDPFYLFQLPGTHHFLRPEIKLEEGYRKALQPHKNELYYSERGDRGLVIFLGDEPHLNAERYAATFFDIVKELGVRRTAAIGGVYGTVPYDKERHVTCTYSLPRMKQELAEYAVQFSNYEGGVSIGSYLGDRAEQENIEYLVMYALVPMYDLSQLSPLLQSLGVEQDWKAWYDVMRRLNHMFGLGLDLSDLSRESDELIESIEAKIRDLEEKMPQLAIKQYVRQVTESFVEVAFLPLDDVWKKGLEDVFKDL